MGNETIPEAGLLGVDGIRSVGRKRILFVDLNLVADRSYARELFAALIPLNVRWFGLSTVLIAHDPDLMELMARSGCRGLLLGLESIAPASLEEANKRFNGSESLPATHRRPALAPASASRAAVFGLDHDDSRSSRCPRQRWSSRAQSLPPLRHPDSLSGNASPSTTLGRNRIHPRLGSLRRPARSSGR